MILNKKASIRTQRLTLQVISKEDTEQLVQLLTNHEITKTFMVPDFKTTEHQQNADLLLKNLQTNWIFRWIRFLIR